VTSQQAAGGIAAARPTVSRTRRLAQTVGTKVIVVILGTVASVVVSHVLQPAGRGTYYLVTTIAATAIVVGSLSLDRAQITLWTHERHRQAVTSNCLLLGPTIGVLAAGLAALVVSLAGPRLVPVTSRELFAIVLIAIPAGTTLVGVMNVLTLRSRVDAVNRGYLLGACSQCLPLVLLGLTGRLTVAWVVIAWTAATGLPLIALLPALHGSKFTPSLPLAARTISIGLRYHAGTVATFLLLRADIFVLNALEPTTTAVGLYSLAVTLAELTKVLTDSIIPVMMPELVESKDGHASSVTAATVRVSILVSCGSVGLMGAAAPVLIPLLYGASFRGSSPALEALAPGLLSLGAVQPITTYLLRLNRPVPMSMLFFAGLAINLGANFALIPRAGIVGASLASSIAYTALAVAQTVWFLRVTRVRGRDLIPRRSDLRLLKARIPQLTPARWSR
jgi:O-antigen/teichoic acid export membrane protein